MIGLCKAIPPVGDTQFELDETATVEPLKFSEQVVNALTVSDFPNLISRSNMLPLILFTIFFGAVTASFGEKAASVIRFLNLMAEIFLKMVNVVMYYAPIGLGAYFAYLVETSDLSSSAPIPAPLCLSTCRRASFILSCFSPCIPMLRAESWV